MIQHNYDPGSACVERVVVSLIYQGDNVIVPVEGHSHQLTQALNPAIDQSHLVNHGYAVLGANNPG